MSFHGMFHRRSENFAIGNVAVAAANHCGNSLDAEAKIRLGSFDFDAICFFHQPLQRLHARLQFAVVQRADVEIKIFKCLRAHSGKLRH